jgi:hypothetical protein
MVIIITISLMVAIIVWMARSNMTERKQQSQITEVSGFPVVIEKQYVRKFKDGDTTPSVKDVKKCKCGTTVVTITDFDDAQDGQEIFILGNANTTVSHNANIKTNTGANKVLAADKVYIFVNFNGVWIEVP